MQIFKSTLNGENIGKEKLHSIDFIRVLCAVGIVFYHVSCHIAPTGNNYFLNYANGNFGELFVGIFLLISGGVLYYNHPKIDSLKAFYFNRWTPIFPMYCLTWVD